MKRNLLIFPVFLLFAGCVVQNDQGFAETNATDAVETVAAAQPVHLEDALMEMYSLMDDVGPGTRSSKTIKSVELIGGQTLRHATRSGESIVDSLLYLVNFDEGGFSVLAADARLQSVLALSFQGELSSEAFTGGASTTPTYSLSDLWVEEDGDYLLGDVNGGVFIADMLISYAMKVIYDFNPNPPTGIDPGIDDIGGGSTNPGTNVTYTYLYGDWQVDEGNTRRRILNNNIRWDQGKPFNEYCPVIDRDTMVAGCTAIAVMQIVAHHQFPDARGLWHGNYSTSYGDVTLRFTLNLSWPALTDSTYTTFNTSLRHSAGWIARWIGHKCNMKYDFFGTGGSFATPAKAADFLEELGYDATRYVGYTGEKLRRSIMEGYPGIVGGISNEKEETRSDKKSKGGHAWVADGWMTRYADYIRRGSDGSQTVVGRKTQSLVHCNWGWSGSCDGYYVSDVFNLIAGPTVVGEGDDQDDRPRNYDFSMRTVIIKR